MWESWLGSAVTAVVVSSFVTVAGWFVSHRNLRQLEDDRRDEKVLDVQTALLAEIVTNLKRFAETDFEVHAKRVSDLILASKRTYTPFIPRYPSTIVFDAIIGDIHILPNPAIQDVIAYYKYEYALRDLMEDLRGDRFSSLDKARKVAFFVEYLTRIKDTQIQGNLAAAALRKSLGSKR